MPTVAFSNSELVIWEIVICCIDWNQLSLTIDPVATVLNLQSSQVQILTSRKTRRRQVGETWVLRYGLFCENEVECVHILELLSDSNIILKIETHMEILFQTVISIDGDGGTYFHSEDKSAASIENDKNLLLKYVPLGNLALILLCCCVYAYHRYCRKKQKRKLNDIYKSYDDIEISSFPAEAAHEQSFSEGVSNFSSDTDYQTLGCSPIGGECPESNL